MYLLTLNTFILLVMSHVLGDMIFTSYSLAIAKRASGFFRQILGLFCHSSIHFLFAGLFLFMGGQNWLKAALLVFALHFFIDFVRCRLEIKLFGWDRPYVKRSEFYAWISRNNPDPGKMNLKNLWPWLMINLFDQGTHLVSLYGISLVV